VARLTGGRRVRAARLVAELLLRLTQDSAQPSSGRVRQVPQLADLERLDQVADPMEQGTPSKLGSVTARHSVAQ
jgi:hypothetical protein